MATMLQAVKNIVKFASVEQLSGIGYDETNLYKIYMSEYGDHAGFSQKAVTEYVQGLPSIAYFPFYNGDILDELERFEVKRKTQKGQDSLLKEYWHIVGYVVFKRLEKNKL